MHAIGIESSECEGEFRGTVCYASVNAHQHKVVFSVRLVEAESRG